MICGDHGHRPRRAKHLYAFAIQVFAGYGDYRATTALIERQLPVFRLKPR
ncbi:hypothetical protein ACFWAY_31665 [Rhodococcus sp. NPDC059968]